MGCQHIHNQSFQYVDKVGLGFNEGWSICPLWSTLHRLVLFFHLGSFLPGGSEVVIRRLYLCILPTCALDQRCIHRWWHIDRWKLLELCVAIHLRCHLPRLPCYCLLG